MNNEMANKTSNIPHFKVKCVDDVDVCLTTGREYDVLAYEDGCYEVKNDFGYTWWYHHTRFEIVETPKDNQEFSVGDNVKVNNVNSTAIINYDRNVKVGDVATVVEVDNRTVKLSNPSWLRNWWFCKTNVSLLDDASLLSHQEVIQAVIDGKELEIQYKDGTWNTVSPMNTTLHQLITLNFRLKPSLEDKRKAVIKKLLTTKVAVLCKCWDDDDIGEEIVAITNVDEDYTYSYISHNGGYKYAYTIDDNGNEITNM